MSKPKSGNWKEAVNEPVNTIGLGAMVALSLALLNPLPLIIGAVVEAAYLLFVPDSKWYARRVEARYDKEVQRRREELKMEVFDTLTPQEQNRFLRLERNREQMDPGSDAKPYYRDVLRRLDYLLEKFLLFAAKRHEFANYLRSMLDELKPPALQPPVRKGKVVREGGVEAVRDDWVIDAVKQVQGRYEKTINEMMERLNTDDNLHNRALLEKRIEIIGRRTQYVAKMGEILVNLSNQLQLLEDTFGLISDEIRARSPEQMLADIDDVVNQSDTLTQRLLDVHPFSEAEVADGADALYNLPR